ncbi:unnamed protein product [Miscanthus lutarioriparius]|uniref:Uncharacterized protein n=1 Tax=Miscanthus lutarioriparius TaxID=422564 RepID=A0A811RHC6_9POAL|nr:unnamed protein product [Miscanthus lutarioriparius]
MAALAALESSDTGTPRARPWRRRPAAPADGGVVGRGRGRARRGGGTPGRLLLLDEGTMMMRVLPLWWPAGGGHAMPQRRKSRPKLTLEIFAYIFVTAALGDQLTISIVGATEKSERDEIMKGMKESRFVLFAFCLISGSACTCR